MVDPSSPAGECDQLAPLAAASLKKQTGGRRPSIERPFRVLNGRSGGRLVRLPAGWSAGRSLAVNGERDGKMEEAERQRKDRSTTQNGGRLPTAPFHRRPSFLSFSAATRLAASNERRSAAASIRASPDRPNRPQRTADDQKSEREPKRAFRVPARHSTRRDEAISSI